jgi:DNA-binding transcriptional LysR family regulator
MNLRNIDLNLLMLFETIYEEQNLTRAAKRLNISQPAISNALARLRETLDDPLFIRTGKGMVPSDRAKQLIDPIHNALTVIRNAIQDQWAFDFKNTRHSFTVTMSDYCESIILPKLMDWIAGVAPGISIKAKFLDEDHLLTDLINGTTDLAIGYITSLNPPQFNSQTLMKEEFVSIVRVDHPEIKNTLTLKQFVSTPHVVTRPRTGENTIDELLRHKGEKRFIALQVPNFLSIPAIIASTDNISTIPLRVAQIYSKMMGLKVLKPPVQPGTREIKQYWVPSRESSPAHTWLRRSLEEICRNL